MILLSPPPFRVEVCTGRRPGLTLRGSSAGESGEHPADPVHCHPHDFVVDSGSR